MQVLAALAGAGFAVVAKQRLQIAQHIVFRTKVAEVLVARGLCLSGLELHGLAVVAVKAVALDHRRLDLFAAKDILERCG
jgi:hypothetical protein